MDTQFLSNMIYLWNERSSFNGLTGTLVKTNLIDVQLLVATFVNGFCRGTISLCTLMCEDAPEHDH